MEQLVETCRDRMTKMGWAENPMYTRRLAWELAEIAAKSKSDYFWKLYSNKVRYPANQNNLLVCKLLGICG
jgi:hypothetical protein